MTSTSVKDVSSIFTNLSAAMGNKATGIGQSGFQAVLNNQTQKNAESQVTENRTTESRTPESRPAAETEQSDSVTPGDTDKVQSEETKNVSAEREGEEMTSEELEEAMAVLETAAVEMIRQTAELLGVPVEEVQNLMEQLGMEELDILDPKQLSALFLQASGAKDPYALVTDAGLYEDYQTLMNELETVMQECGEQLGTDPAQMSALLAKIQERPAVQSETPIVEVSHEKGTVENELPVAGEITVPENTGAEARTDAAASGREEGHKESRPDDGEQQGNLFLQNLKAEEFQPEVQQTAETARLAEADNTENIMRQIMDYMKIQVKADTSDLEMQLHPASLGTVQVQIASRGGALTANFITQNEAVKAALESQMAQLIERFDEQGVKVEAIEVTVQTHEFERNLEQGRGREQQNEEPAKKGRIRRLNLNDAVSMENMEEEDALAADMMAANGNTVDYTA
ncbi:MAG: flagellar hook-length control protein FliK [Acetatifactor sp.]|nr:flagellar hook-length control protein FliK [Acetatifactor sp.]